MTSIFTDDNGGKGLIFNIQRFSVNDGPGIRTTVFMKGCPLSCRWCANPESQAFTPQLMIRDAKCTGCGACVAHCPRGAIRMDMLGTREIDWDNCDQCLLCVDACDYDALAKSGETMTAAAVFQEVMRDRLFYKNSGGGVTISGGEPLLQIEFITSLLRRCREEGLQTAIDTTGYVGWPKIEAVVPWTTLMLWDIKHLAPRMHRQATGVGNQLILENLERVSQMAKIWLRIPLIAGFNDDTDHMKGVVALARRMNIEKISLLPYHDGGRTKCEQIGNVYPTRVGRPPGEGTIDLLKAIIVDAGIDVGIGN